MIVPVIHPVDPTEHGGGLKTLVAVVASVAIPVLAPTVASSLGISKAVSAVVSAAGGTLATGSTSAAIAATASTAIAGATMGAVKAKVLGQDVEQGALMGAITSAPSGYFNQAKTLGTNLQPAAATASGAQAGLSTGIQTGADPTLIEKGIPVGSEAVATTEPGVLANVKEGFAGMIKSGLGTTGEKILSKISDPDTLASMTLTAGSLLLGQALAPTPELPPELQQNVEAMAQELAILKERDEAAFNAKMDAAKAYLQQAGYYDPTYFATQAASQQAISEGKKLRDFQQQAGLKYGGLSAGELRRAQLGGGLNVASAYDRGFQKGLGLQDQAISAGLGAIPGASTTVFDTTQKLGDTRYDMYRDDVKDAKEKRSNISAFFNRLNAASGESDEEKKEKENLDDAGFPAGDLA